VHRALALLVLLPLISCGQSSDDCKQGEGPTLRVELVPLGVDATPAVVGGGGSNSLQVTASDAHQIVEATVTGGALAQGSTKASLVIVHSGTAQISGVDALGRTYERSVTVRC
jgi:hypothetical protein